jgi:hypothetical protein
VVLEGVAEGLVTVAAEVVEVVAATGAANPLQ